MCPETGSTIARDYQYRHWGFYSRFIYFLSLKAWGEQRIQTPRGKERHKRGKQEVKAPGKADGETDKETAGKADGEADGEDLEK